MINNKKLHDRLHVLYWYLYWLSVQAVPITDIANNSISAADSIADLIIGTSLVNTLCSHAFCTHSHTYEILSYLHMHYVSYTCACMHTLTLII